MQSAPPPFPSFSCYMMRSFASLAAAVLLAVPPASADAPSPVRIGIFTDHTDIGAVGLPGTAVYDPVWRAYTVTGSGVDMWDRSDMTSFVWQRASGDLSIAADILLVGTSDQPHRKACLMIRQSLEPNSPYVDAAVHGYGLAALQYRAAPGGITHEIQSDVATPRRVRLDKIGDTVYLSIAADGDPKSSGASIRIALKDPFYIGLAACAHDNTGLETALFRRVEVGAASPSAAAPQPDVEIEALPNGDQRAVRSP
jgi:TolB protein